jgi:exoribonuclease R
LSIAACAGYQAFDGDVPLDAEHSALATDYAHCTAPLRRLVDRYVGEVCVALCAGTPVPAWVREALPGLPAEMAVADRRAKKYERAVVDLVEVVLLAPRVGEVFAATVVDVDDERRRGTVVVADPAVQARVSGEGLPLGQEIRVRLVSADLASGAVAFQRVD